MTTYTVSNSGSGYYIISSLAGSNPTINLYRGITYIFIINAAGHPFWIKTIQGVGNGNQYNDGVTNNGYDNGTLTFIVPLNAPATLYYNCQYHSSMQGIINITDEPIPCYSKGTLILTNRGYIKIEDIKKGDIVVTKGKISNGFLEKNINAKEVPIIWINNFKVKILNSFSRPICITKNAFGENYPFVDLYLSPCHRLFINDKMITPRDLINGETIYQDNECEFVEYYHLECEEHSAIYANGVLAETYLEYYREIFNIDK